MASESSKTPPSPTGYLPPLYSRDDITPGQRKGAESVASSSDSSSSDSTNSWDSDYVAQQNQLQWEESMRQLQLLFSVVVLPYAAKWAGRKWAYWAYERYLNVGLGKRFWLGPVAVWIKLPWISD
ncbi:hypothetical protein T439DRAFT_323485 [Meredithblackwellia eburnea MCA 4105]